MKSPTRYRKTALAQLVQEQGIELGDPDGLLNRFRKNVATSNLDILARAHRARTTTEEVGALSS